MFYQIILGLVKENVGDKGLKFFPLIFTTFMLMLGCNVLGMIPYSFTVTSHLIVTFSLAIMTFIGMYGLMFLTHKMENKQTGIFAVLELIITVVIPLVLALWLAGWIYGTFVGSSITKSIYEPFWFFRSQRF